jgi:hypothetical protein
MTELLKGLYLARYGGAHDADGGVELGLGVRIQCLIVCCRFRMGGTIHGAIATDYLLMRERHSIKREKTRTEHRDVVRRGSIMAR